MSSGSGGKTGLTQGPFQFGPSPYDTSAIEAAIQGIMDPEITARYKQLGLGAPGGGASTMQTQDLAQAGNLGNAAIGQLQTAEIGQPAFNPALQTPTTNQQGTVTGAGIGTALGAGLNLLKPS